MRKAELYLYKEVVQQKLCLGVFIIDSTRACIIAFNVCDRY